jgi:hypothetical protein
MRATATRRFAIKHTVAAAMLSLALAGCGSSGPSGSSAPARTSASAFVLITVRTDTPAPVVFIQCKATCNELHEHRPIAAGSSTRILGLNEGRPFADLVESATGKRLGCVYMKFDHVKAPPVVLVSSMTSCK